MNLLAVILSIRSFASSLGWGKVELAVLNLILNFRWKIVVQI